MKEMGRAIHKTVLTAAVLTLGALMLENLTAADTDPVGIVVITLKGGSDTRATLPMHRDEAFSGRIMSVDADNQVITVAQPANADPIQWAENQFVLGDQDNPDPGKNNTYCVVIDSGTQNGAFYKVTANGSNTLTVEPGLNDLSTLKSEDADGQGNGDTLRIIPYWTLATMFGNADLPDGMQVFTFDYRSDGVFEAPETTHTYYKDYTTWSDGVGVTDHTALFKPGDGFLIRLPANSDDLLLENLGAVPMFNDRKVVFSSASGPGNDHPMGITSPVPVSIGDTNLGVDDQTLLLLYDHTATGNFKAPHITATYYKDYDVWTDGVNVVNDTLTLEPGVSFILRKPATGSTPELVETSYTPKYLQ